MPPRQDPDLIFESVNGRLRRNGIEIMSVQLGFDPVASQLEFAFPASYFESEKLESLRDMHNPGLLRVERPAELFENRRIFLD